MCRSHRDIYFSCQYKLVIRLFRSHIRRTRGYIALPYIIFHGSCTSRKIYLHLLDIHSFGVRIYVGITKTPGKTSDIYLPSVPTKKVHLRVVQTRSHKSGIIYTAGNPIQVKRVIPTWTANLHYHQRWGWHALLLRGKRLELLLQNRKTHFMSC